MKENKISYEKIRESMPVPQIKEELAPYLVHKKQGEYTIEDYYALPDEQRVELIDGVIYDMAGPTTLHQGISDEIRERVSLFIKEKSGKCFAMTSPVDVQLDCDDRTIVQPDIIVVCNRDKFRKNRIYGVPDYIVEVLSPSTRKKDFYIKTDKYRKSGVREYWMVDPEKRRIYVYMFEKDELPMMYTFEDKVPVGIFEEECKIDFAKIYEYVSFLYD